MNADPDKQQDELQRMLALKRLETPPPRFFSKFSEKVIDGLNSPSSLTPPTLWQRLGLDFDSRPVLVCASGVVVCGLLGAAVILSLQVPPPKPAARAPDDSTHRVVAPPPTSRPSPEDEPAQPPVAGAEQPLRLDQPVIVPARAPLSAVKFEPATSDKKEETRDR